MTEDITRADLTECGAHQRGHFLLSSGLHSGDYLQCALYLAQPRRAARAGGLLAASIQTADLAPDISPPGWGMSVAEARDRALAGEGPDAVEAVASWDFFTGHWKDFD